MIAQHPERDQIRLENVLAALGNPIRLNIVRILAQRGEQACGTVGADLDATMSKSTLTHHWRVLRDSGVIWQRPAGRENLLSLRTEDLAERYPGLLASILGCEQETEKTSLAAKAG
ncbi:ArsR/SmtB family transcription factor [Amycolatopsis thailandensis]|uniref:Transcriptional regulator n=1 Tax=Amycolatopsis thailandensis TaxID=589330 RepID=A0A229SI80_9PSEU|nr:helix-turn-helix transcriptional regulator [Amycolatopsis thailandensis]OXM58590.1 transcriptional regulator [Amycolatopsis thailandensis]